MCTLHSYSYILLIEHIHLLFRDHFIYLAATTPSPTPGVDAAHIGLDIHSGLSSQVQIPGYYIVLPVCKLSHPAMLVSA